MRRAIDLISTLHSSWDRERARHGMFLSFDIQKAFDSLSWSYLFCMLKKLNFSPKCIASLYSLYSNSKAQISLQDHRSEPSSISSGTHQGCPLPPLLFIIAMETLAIAIHQDSTILGIMSGDRNHKICAFCR